MKNRFRILIYPRFQLLLVAINFFVLLSVSGALYFQYQRAQTNIRQLGLDANLPPTHGFFQLVDIQSREYLASLGAAMIFGFLFSAFVTLLVSNKLAGPIVRLRRYFGEISESEGVPSKLSFRKGDFFSDLPHTINRAIEKLQSRH